MTGTRTAAVEAALAAMLGLAALCWVVAIRQMDGMDMGVATELGTFAFFLGAWVPMMAAMMLPGAVPAVLRSARAWTAPFFAASYIAVWSVIGLAVYAMYQPHSVAVAVAVTIAAAMYELTPLKRECRRRCHSHIRSGFRFGLYCVGSSIGLMAIFVAWGPMSVVWMSIVAGVVVVQKLVPPTERSRQ